MGYLVIALKIGERVMVGEAEVVVSDIDRNHVHLAIQAPKSVRIARMKTHIQAEMEKHNGEKTGDIRFPRR